MVVYLLLFVFCTVLLLGTSIRYWLVNRCLVKRLSNYDVTGIPNNDGNDLFRSYVELASDVCLRFDRNGLLTYANPAAVEWCGSGIAELYGKDSSCLPMFSIAEHFKVMIDCVLGNEAEENLELVFFDSTKCPGVRSMRFFPERDTDGSVTGVIVIGKHVAKSRDELKESRELSVCHDEEHGTHHDLVELGIYDTIGQLLLAQRADIEILRRYLFDENQSRQKCAEQLYRMLTTVDSTIKMVRCVTDNLGISPCNQQVEVALEWLVDEFQHRTGIEGRFSVSGKGISLNEDAYKTLFSVLRETLENIAQHIQTTHVIVTLGEIARHCVLRVSDDGRGDVVDSQYESVLPYIQERIHAMGGKFFCQSEPGDGALIEVWLPLQESSTGNVVYLDLPQVKH